MNKSTDFKIVSYDLNYYQEISCNSSESIQPCSAVKYDQDGAQLFLRNGNYFKLKSAFQKSFWNFKYFQGLSLKVQINTKHLNQFQSFSWLSASVYSNNNEYGLEDFEGLLGRSEKYSMPDDSSRKRRDIIDDRLNEIKTNKCKRTNIFLFLTLS